MPRKTAAEKAAEEAAAVEAARRETEQQRLKWLGIAIIALALFAGGYAVGQSNAEELPQAFLPFEGGISPVIDVPFEALPEFYGEYHDELPPFVAGGEFPPFDFDRFDRPRAELSCRILERGGGTVVLECEGPALSDRGPLERRPDDERRDDERRDEEPGFLGVAVNETYYGVVVVRVVEDGPAERAGIEPEDVIVGFGDAEIESAGQLGDLIADAGAGVEVPITLIRSDSEVTVWVLLGEPPR
jgi:membrane-associated protease RseP (regulator of RpoE activity)